MIKRNKTVFFSFLFNATSRKFNHKSYPAIFFNVCVPLAACCFLFAAYRLLLTKTF